MSNERSLAGIIIFLALAILALGVGAYVKLDGYVHAQTEDTLSRVAQVQVGQFTAWWGERTGDVSVIMADRYLAKQVEAYLPNVDDTTKRLALTDRLGIFLRAYPYKTVALYGPNGQLLINQVSAGAAYNRTLRQVASQALQEKRVVYSEMHVEEFNDGLQTIDIDIAVPLRSTIDGPVIGVVGLTVNTEPFMNSSIRNSPLLIDSMEIVLAHKSGDQVTIVNPRARSSGESPIYQLPLETPDLPAARAARGERGLVTGRDYRGTPVTACLQGIPSSDWVIIVKVDQRKTVAYQENILIGVGVGIAVLSLLAYMLLRFKLMQSEADFLQAEVQARRKQDVLAQQAQSATKRLLGILENTPIGLAIISLDRIIEHANTAFCAIYDAPQGNLVGKSAEVLYFSTEDFAELGRRAYPILHSGGLFDDVVTMKRRDGSEVQVRLTSRVIDLDGEPPVVVWAAEDVTEKCRMEQVIRERERFYEDMFQSSAAINLLIDPVSRVIVDCNDSACRFYGYDREQLRSMRLDQISTLPEAELVPWLQQLCSERHLNYQSRHKLFDGALREVDLFSNQIVVNGELRLMMIVYDITERVSNEEKLRQAHDAMRLQKGELERSNADLEQFAYVASHDLRQPLRQVASFLGLLERRYASNLNEEARGYIDFACKGAKKMDVLIIDLLEFSRIGRQKDEVQPCSLVEVIADAVENLSVSISEAKARVSIPDTLPTIMGNRGELVRLWQNLIGNAVKYRRPDQMCTIDVTSLQDGNRVVLKIKDNGIGIAPEYHDRVFGIFQRLHQAGTYEGTGIGLAICRRIVEHHKGSIRIESDGQTGSTFVITLPL